MLIFINLAPSTFITEVILTYKVKERTTKIGFSLGADGEQSERPVPNFGDQRHTGRFASKSFHIIS